MNIKERALKFATEAHAGKFNGVFQTRNYSGEPYILHPIEVANILRDYGYDSDAIQATAYLHDVVEDCGVSIEQVREEFGDIIAMLVFYVTDISKKSDGNRQKRKAMDRAHYALGPAESQTVKVADLISNTRSIVKHDQNFASVYIPEKRMLLDTLVLADKKLVSDAKILIADSIVALSTMGVSIRR